MQKNKQHSLLRTISIRNKLAILTILPVALLCISIFIFVPSRYTQEQYASLGVKAQTEANIAAYSSRVGVIFDDKESLEATIKAIAQDTMLTYVAVVNENGTCLSEYSNFGEKSLEVNHTTTPGIHGNNDFIVSTSPILMDGEHKGMVIVCVSLDQANKQVAQLRMTITIALLFVLAVSAMILFSISNIIVNPLLNVVDAVATIASGKLDHRANVTTQDEVGLLATSVNRMAQNLTRVYHELEEANGTLEDKVLNRTEELQHEVQIRIKTEIDLRSAIEQAEIANRAKSAFLASMSHELRTPLNSIIGFAQILKNEISIEAKPREFICTMHRSGLHLLSMINDILDISKIEAGELEIHTEGCNIRQLVADIESMFTVTTTEKGLQLHVHIQENVPNLVEADTKRLRQVLLNLCSNAVKFTKNGWITLRVEQVHNTHENSTPVLRFTVKDSGRGIAPDQHENIFKPFRQDQSMHSEGTGLGLAICKKIVEKMNGTIGVESSVGIGSEFWFEIPVGVNPNRSPSDSTVAPKELVGITTNRPIKILIIDDIEDNRSILNILLSDSGFVCSEAENGEQGINRMAIDKPDLVLVDLMMPVMNGFEVINYIRTVENDYSTPVYAITASVLTSTSDELKNKGFTGAIGKPFELDTIYTILLSIDGVEPIYSEKKRSRNGNNTLAEGSQNCEHINKTLAELPQSLRDDILIQLEVQDFDLLQTVLEFIPPDSDDKTRLIAVLADIAQTHDYKKAHCILQNFTNWTNRVSVNV